MSVEAAGSVLLSQGVVSEAQLKDLLDDRRRVEEEATTVVIGNPIVSRWTGT
jgi:hypothetical protein